MKDIKLKRRFDTDYQDTLNKYYSLVSCKELSESDAKTLDSILEQAETDERLSFLLNEIDELTFEELGFYEQKSMEQIQEQKEKVSRRIKISSISYIEASRLAIFTENKV